MLVVLVLLYFGTATESVAGEIFVEPHFDFSLIVDADHILVGRDGAEEGVESVVASG